MSHVNKDDGHNENEIDKILNNIVSTLPNLKKQIETIISTSQDEEANIQLEALGKYIDEITNRFNSLVEATDISAKVAIINEISAFYKIINGYLSDSNAAK
jgi:uncharacterized protein YoxC